MRAVSITVHNNRELEVFVEKREEGFELWVVGPIKGRRVLLDHSLTHDDLEAHLEYAQPGDLVWRDASPSEIPVEKHRNAIEVEEAVKQGIFSDYIDPEAEESDRELRRVMGYGPALESNWSVTLHITSISFLTTDQKEANTAKNAISGRWSDGVVTMSFEPDHQLVWSCTDPLDPFGRQRYAPDWWNYETWNLALMNSEYKSGMTMGVLHVDGCELHLTPSNHRHRLARVFYRIKTAGEQVEEAVDSDESSDISPKRERVSRAAGEVTPLLHQLEQVLIERNPIMAERLNPGLSESEIRETLSQANVSGNIEALVQLYSWSNGTAIEENDSLEEASLFPESIYRFMDLNEAIVAWREMNKAVETLQEMFDDKKSQRLLSGFKGQFFPIFTDSAGGEIAIDLTPSKRNRVMLIDFENGKPVQAYRSFESFIKDAIRANKEDDELSCFSYL